MTGFLLDKSQKQSKVSKVQHHFKRLSTGKKVPVVWRKKGNNNKMNENRPHFLPYSPEKRAAFQTQYSPCPFLSSTNPLVSQKLVTSTLSRPLHFGVLNNKAIKTILRWPLDNKGPGVTWTQQNYLRYPKVAIT